ncbi:unnamed protein product, partial [marine sediment metagenome]
MVRVIAIIVAGVALGMTIAWVGADRADRTAAAREQAVLLRTDAEGLWTQVAQLDPSQALDARIS